MRSESLPRTPATEPSGVSAAPPAGTPLREILSSWAGADADRQSVADTVERVAGATVRLAALVAGAPLNADALPDVDPEARGGGDQAKPLDLAAERILLDSLRGGLVAAVASEESEAPITIEPGAGLVLTTDPIDGSGNIDINAPIGSIFSVLPVGEHAADPAAALLQTGRAQLAAGFTVYSASTILVLTLGERVDAYALDPDSQEYRLLSAGLRAPQDSQEYAINASNSRHWAQGIRSYIADMVEGASGPREQDFNMRWIGALVAEAYRILLRGGIYLYPADVRPGYERGRLRLVYEANPIAMIFEAAGGAATDGLEAILDLVPTDHHQRTALVFGSASKVDRVRRYLSETRPHDTSPLFGTRGLFRD
ncbi:class 1 fructose-bisphosphatase [Nocardioides sp.]|uniref:class 1 fructose-bisphosphatase n=1 Tax=Nocardioides sp. TaxID=35761 RepID=UPI00352881EF